MVRDPDRSRTEVSRYLLSAIRDTTDWRRADEQAARVDSSEGEEFRFHHPTIDGVLLMQSPDPIDGAAARLVLYQPLLSSTNGHSAFRTALQETYRGVVDASQTPAIEALSDPPAVAAATVGSDWSRADTRRLVSSLAHIAHDISDLHARLFRTLAEFRPTRSR